LNRPELESLAARSDVERLTESYRREQAQETVAQGREIEELHQTGRGLIINFDLKKCCYNR